MQAVIEEGRELTGVRETWQQKQGDDGEADLDRPVLIFNFKS
jgi:hypothetical protein